MATQRKHATARKAAQPASTGPGQVERRHSADRRVGSSERRIHVDRRLHLVNKPARPLTVENLLAFASAPSAGPTAVPSAPPVAPPISEPVALPAALPAAPPIGEILPPTALGIVPTLSTFVPREGVIPEPVFKVGLVLGAAWWFLADYSFSGFARSSVPTSRKTRSMADWTRRVRD